MQKPRLVLAVLALAAVAVLGVFAWKAPVANSSANASPGSGEGAVLVSREVGGNHAITVTVRRVGEEVLSAPGTGPDLSGLAGKVVPFAVALDTHDGDISELDLNGRVFVRDSDGVEIPGMARQLSTSSHHTTFVVAFPKLDSRGNPLDAPENRRITFVVKEVGSLRERVLEWKL